MDGKFNFILGDPHPYGNYSRLIKFRGLGYTKEWHYGLLSRPEFDDQIVDKNKFYISNSVGKPFGFQIDDPATIGQFTGLLDKNGKEIYEHDILLFHHLASKEKHIVLFCNGSFVLDDASILGPIVNQYQNFIEIIGDIHHGEMGEIFNK